MGIGGGEGTGDVVLVRVKCNISNGPITYYPAVVCSCFCLFKFLLGGQRFYIAPYDFQKLLLSSEL